MKEDKLLEWLKEYAIHGGNVPLNQVLEDIRAHSPFWQPKPAPVKPE